MSWDDDVAIMAENDEAILAESWDADESVLMESWDAEPQAKPKAAAKKPAAKKPTAKKAVDKTTAILDSEDIDEKTRKELLRRAELEADFQHASDLIGDLALAEQHPRERASLSHNNDLELDSMIGGARLTRETPIEKHPLFKAQTKKEYQELRKSLATAITTMHENSSLLYASDLAIDLTRDICKPLSIESIRQTVATLNALIKEKEKEERLARLARVKGGTATGGAGKKKAKGKTNLGGAFKKDQDFDIDDSKFDDFGDDDFM